MDYRIRGVDRIGRRLCGMVALCEAAATGQRPLPSLRTCRWHRRVNDTLSLDVTLLEATTDSAWQALCSDFAITRVVEEMVQINPDLVLCRQVSRHDYTRVICGDHPDAELLTISCASKTLAIFHTHTHTEIRAVLYYTWPKQ